MTYDSWKAREPLPFSGNYPDDEGPIIETRVPTEADVAYAQQGFEDADKAWSDAVLRQFGDLYYSVRYSALARGRLGTELRLAYEYREIADDHYRSVWNDYLGRKLRDFP